MVLREIKVLYKQTILGFSWAIIRPFVSMIVFSVIFGGLAKIPSDGIPYPVFSYVALVPWTYFSASMNKSTMSLINSTTIFTKVYFPRMILPLTPVLSGLIDFIIALSLSFGLLIYYKINISLNIIYLPFLILIMILTSSGIGLWLSSMAIQYRDIRHATQFLSQLLMYIAPVVWPISMLESKFGYKVTLICSAYPMVGVIEGFRAILIGKNEIPWDYIFVGFISSIFIFITGSIYFKSKENFFADVA